MTVTVTNDDGQPQAGVAVLLTRDYAYSRGEVDKQYIDPGVIGEPDPLTTSPANMMLTPVAPAAGAAVAFNNQNGLSTKWSGFTGDDGKLRFTLTQDKSLGLKRLSRRRLRINLMRRRAWMRSLRYKPARTRRMRHTGVICRIPCR